MTNPNPIIYDEQFAYAVSNSKIDVSNLKKLIGKVFYHKTFNYTFTAEWSELSDMLSFKGVVFDENNKEYINDCNSYNEVIASNNPALADKLLYLELPEKEEIDVRVMATKSEGGEGGSDYDKFHAYIRGANAILELKRDKVFGLEQMQNAIDMAFEKGKCAINTQFVIATKEKNEIISSITPKPVSCLPEMVEKIVSPDKYDESLLRYDHLTQLYYLPTISTYKKSINGIERDCIKIDHWNY